MHQNLWEGPSLTCNKTSLNGPIEPGMVSFERYASSPVGNVQFHLFGRIKEPQKDFFLSSPKESWQILPQKVDRQKLLFLYLNNPAHQHAALRIMVVGSICLTLFLQDVLFRLIETIPCLQRRWQELGYPLKAWYSITIHYLNVFVKLRVLSHVLVNS